MTREELYERVWAEPTTKVATSLGISSNYLGRVCEALNVPHPERGYWARKQFGKKTRRPLLPPAQPGQPLAWEPGGALSVPKTQAAARANKGWAHVLLADAKENLQRGWPTDLGYVKPYKRNIVDVFVTPARVGQAVDTLTDLFELLNRRRHRVALSDSYVARPFVTLKGTFKKEEECWNRDWSPGRATLAYIDGVAIGLLLVEVTQAVQVQWSDKQRGYVPVDEAEPQRRRLAVESWRSPMTKDMPSGRLLLCAYSPFSERGDWHKEWCEKKPGDLRGQIRRIVTTLEQSTSEIRGLTDAAQQRRDEERRQWEAAAQERRVREAAQRRLEAEKSSQRELLQTIEAWAVNRNIEAFFNEVEQSVKTADDTQREALLARIIAGRAMLGDTSAVRRLLQWRTPSEMLRE